ncbi:hypothetical protein MIND_00617900 [Mycena indigotica]|uniref:Transcription factor IIIC 90kDa subunit N-terminal domain-containing protein n=1 Tax=Mycena indigotica TaxID=2126181 RepID=A0A8H6SRI5_9AGAR|nr:uncharacterized protein MIND_00617900 [Mycena indigotica]KAF7303878.1 hypothetical protein MIND_00617900 [Mycena indigotica]
MAHPPIYTALNAPVVASVPSTSSLQCTADGQILFLTKTSLYIMTPNHGLNFDLVPPIQAQPRKMKKTPSEIEEEVEPIGWFRTLVQFDRPVNYVWPEQSQNWNAMAMGTLDIALWAVASSPSGLSPNATCIVAALTSSMDLSLWTSQRNALNGEWSKIFDVTPFLLDYFSDESSSVRALRAQITSIHWSLQCDFGIRPATLDGSLLVAGNRAGMLLVFSAVVVSQQWIIRVAISQWRTIEQGRCHASVAFSADDGTVGCVNIEQVLEDAPSATTFGLSFTVRLEILDDEPREVARRDIRPARGLQWIELSKTESVLAFTKPGIIGLWRGASSFWSGLKQFTLRQTPRLSCGTSIFSNAIGLIYVPKKDALLVALADGSIHGLHAISRQPTWDFAQSPALMSDTLSRVARTTFVRVEPPSTVDVEVVARVSGMASYDGGATMVWLHEAVRPADYSYKHDARHTNLFVVAKLWSWNEEDDGNTAVVQNLVEVLQGSRAACGITPAHILRPVFLALSPRRINDENGLHAQILSVLPWPDSEDETHAIKLVPWTGASGSEMRREFRDSMTAYLFGLDDFLKLRSRLGVADFLWKHLKTEQKRDDVGVVATALVLRLSHGFVRTIIRHLVAAIGCLEASDAPFVFRMVMHTLLADVPVGLKEEGTLLARAMTATLPNTESNVTNGLTEFCPACRVEIPFTQVGVAICSRRHHWDRCSITTFILSSTRVRACVGCGRKAFLSSDDNGLPPSARGWAITALLEAIQRCLFCGNTFASAL